MSRRYAVFKFLRMPLVWLVALFDRRQAKLDREPELPPGPRPLKARKRALTLPLGADEIRRWGQKTCAQEQSGLFRKLPEEVRSLIWEETIGGMEISLKMVEMRLRQDRSWKYFAPNRPKGLVRAAGDSNSLPLLLACRRCYSEAINILYSTNVFDAAYSRVIGYLPQLILPQRLHAIRLLVFDWGPISSVPFYVDIQDEKRFRNYEREWYVVWKVLASMSGLRTLYVRLDVSAEYHQQWQDDEDKALQSAAMVTAPKNFELAVSWMSMFQEPALNTLPCRVTKLTDSKWDTPEYLLCRLGTTVCRYPQ